VVINGAFLLGDAMSSDRYEKGIEEMRRHVGVLADEYVARIREVSPLFAKVNVEFAFGDLYANHSPLDEKTRELCTLAALTVQGSSLPQLELHVAAALRVGASKEEICEVITQMLAYCGFPAATNALMTAKKVFEKQGLL
jgi:4-carboxymuconolactone decarboxylase